jgi:hypothetical protein
VNTVIADNAVIAGIADGIGKRNGETARRRI